MKTLVIGGCSVDTLIHVDEIKTIVDDMMLYANNTVESIGGTGAGKALSLDILGNEVTWITEVGDDENSEKILNYFGDTSVNVIPLMVDKTIAHTNIMHSKGKRISIFTSIPTVNSKVLDGIQEIIKDIDVIFLNINDFCRSYIPYIKSTNIPIVVDIHDYDPPNPYHQDFIEVADILIASGVNIDNHHNFLSNQITNGKQLVVITNGKDGLIALDDKQILYELPGYNDFEYIDSNGAGDSFCAGLMTKLLETENNGEALKFGTICGGIACTTYDLYNKEYSKEKIDEIKKRVDF